jgi:hypothetical protein
LAQVGDPFAEYIGKQNANNYTAQQDEAAAARQQQQDAAKQQSATEAAQRDLINDPVAKSVYHGSSGQLTPSMPEWGPAYQAEKARQEKQRIAEARAGAAPAAKPLPPSNVTDIADADSAVASVDQLLSSFDTNVPSGGMANNLYSRVAGLVPNTDVSTFDSESNITTQVVGSFLEGGVLKEQDFKRYKNMLPKAGDNPEVAAKKAANVKRLIETRQAGRRQQLSAAGYNVPPPAPAAAQPSPDQAVQPPPGPVNQPPPPQAGTQAGAAQSAQPQQAPASVQEPQGYAEPQQSVGPRGQAPAGQTVTAPAMTTKAVSPDVAISLLRKSKQPYKDAQKMVRQGLIGADQAAEYVAKARQQ